MHGQGMKSYLLNDLLIITSFNAFIAKLFQNDGNIYEGEIKFGKKNGQGKKSA